MMIKYFRFILRPKFCNNKTFFSTQIGHSYTVVGKMVISPVKDEKGYDDCNNLVNRNNQFTIRTKYIELHCFFISCP